MPEIKSRRMIFPLPGIFLRAELLPKYAKTFAMSCPSQWYVPVLIFYQKLLFLFSNCTLPTNWNFLPSVPCSVEEPYLKPALQSGNHVYHLFVVLGTVVHRAAENSGRFNADFSLLDDRVFLTCSMVCACLKPFFPILKHGTVRYTWYLGTPVPKGALVRLVRFPRGSRRGRSWFPLCSYSWKTWSPISSVGTAHFSQSSPSSL